MKQAVVLVLAGAFTLAGGLPLQAQDAPKPQAAFAYGPAIPSAELDAIRKATEKYRDVNAALADGYVLAMPMCATSTMEGLPRQLGAMGLHYARMDLLKPVIPENGGRVDGAGVHLDFTQPAVLMYEPQADGSLVLAGIENVVWASAWKKLGKTEPPSYHGFDYYLTIDNPATPDVDEAHGFEPHYELHWWLYRDNPNGAFAPYNAAVSCEHWKGEHKH